MAVLIFSFEGAFYRLSVAGGGAMSAASASEYVYPYPIPGGVSARYVNRVWDAAKGVGGAYHSWETVFQDRTGIYYNGPGVWGVDVDPDSYVVETISHGRS